MTQISSAFCVANETPQLNFLWKEFLVRSSFSNRLDVKKTSSNAFLSYFSLLFIDVDFNAVKREEKVNLHKVLVIFHASLSLIDFLHLNYE